MAASLIRKLLMILKHTFRAMLRVIGCDSSNCRELLGIAALLATEPPMDKYRANRSRLAK